MGREFFTQEVSLPYTMKFSNLCYKPGNSQRDESLVLYSN
jgi:hypothetical protein